jgi:tRNA A37 methylthiotransferase MiaB
MTADYWTRVRKVGDAVFAARSIVVAFAGEASRAATRAVAAAREVHVKITQIAAYSADAATSFRRARKAAREAEISAAAAAAAVPTDDQLSLKAQYFS